MRRLSKHLANSRDLCMRCPLPECDFMHRDCLLKDAVRREDRLKSAGKPVPADVKAGAGEWFRQWKIEWLANKSENRA